MKKFTAMLLGAAMLLSLAACGDKAESIETELPEEPAANVNPTFINWGNRRNELRPSDPWYPEGKVGDEYIYFITGNSSSGIEFYHEKAGAQEGYTPCALTEDLHLVSEGGTEIDIVFYDEFRAYDYASEKWYVRADSAAIKSLFADKNFVEQNDAGNTILLRSDGSAMEVYQGQEFPGTWKLINATTVAMSVEDGDYYFEILLNSDGTLQCLDELNNRCFLPAE